MSSFKRIVSLAITGGSGAQYALRLLQCLLAADSRVYLMISRAGEVVINTETDWDLPQGQTKHIKDYFYRRLQPREGQLEVFDREDWFAPVASGSSATTPMVICPASGGTISAIASGASNNLIERAADVAIKEKWPLIVVPREAPYSTIHLKNMLTLSQLGVVVLPASPGFYHQPKSIEDLVDFVVGRVLDQLNIDQTIMPRWGSN